MTREEAIKIFQVMKKIMSIPNSDAARMIEAIDMAIEALQREEAEEKGYCHRIKPKEYFSAEAEWIPCSERLPIPPTFCLVTTDGSHGDVIDIALYMSDGWHKASEVLAWMPLPTPYKGGVE